jgi:hypothetical protein
MKTEQPRRGKAVKSRCEASEGSEEESKEQSKEQSKEKRR